MSRLVARGASRTIYFIEIYERNDVEAHYDHALEHVCAPGVLRLVGIDERVREGLGVVRGSRRVGFATSSSGAGALGKLLWRFLSRPARCGDFSARRHPPHTWSTATRALSNDPGATSL